MKRYLEVKSGSLSDTALRLRDDYQALFKAELEKAGKGLAQMTDSEKKAFFNKIDKMHNAKSEMMNTQPVKSPVDMKTVMVVKPGAPKGKENVIRVSKEKLPDYMKKGYIEAENFVPESSAKEGVLGAVAGGTLGYMAGNIPGAIAGAYLGHKIQKAAKKKEEKEIDELTAGQKKLPLALQKAIKAKEKNEEVEINESERDSERNSGGMYALQAIKAKRQRLEQELKNLNKDDANYKEKAASLKKQIEGQKEIMARKQREVFDSYDPNFDLDLLDEMTFTSYAKEQMSLKNAKDKRSELKNKYNAIMAGQADGDEGVVEDQIRKLDMSIKKQEQDLIDKMKKMKKEAVDPERIANLQQRIQKMTADMGKIDMAKPENKTKQAIYKSDIQTAQLRLKDLIQKKTSELSKQVKETKMGYKSFRQSLKKEQDKKDPKKTMTGQPVDTINTEPKLEIK